MSNFSPQKVWQKKLGLDWDKFLMPPSNWPNRTIGDLVTLQRGIDLPDVQRRAGRIPIMGSFGITGRHDKAACKGPGVTVGRSGASAGVVNYIQEDYWPLNTCLYVRDFHGNNPRFAYYLLKTLDLASFNSGSAQPSLNRNFVHPVPVTFPARPEQDVIASILGALDDKMELNRRMNETLEAMARAIFKDWFVDFGPIRAKMEGRAPYLAPEIWSLFPDQLNEEGKPEKWNDIKIGDIAERIAMGPFGSNIKVETFVETGIPIISGQHLRGTMLDDSQSNCISEGHADKLSNSNVKRGDIVFTHAGNIGQVAIIPETSRFNRYVLSQRQFFLRCNRQKASPLFVLYYFKSPKGQHNLLANSSQVGVPSIARPATNLKAIELTIPSKPLMDAFDHIINSLHLKIGVAKKENEMLSATRDLLLPKLMSGEIRLRDAERALEAVA